MNLDLDESRLRGLLEEIDRHLAILRDPGSHGRTSAEVVATVDALHRDVGRRVHEAWAAREPDDSLDEIQDVEPVEMLDRAPTPRDDGPWVDALQDLLALLDAPTAETDPVSLAVEAARMQWATVGLADRWPRFPEAIQVALLGLIAARCRFLAETMPVDLGPLAALDRLAAYRRLTGITPVVGLVLERGPESASWTDDAIHWWGMLTAGLSEPT
jgi:hypothetical protein